MQPLGADEPAAVGPYRLLGRLGSGGMGRVYLGRSAGGRTVAVKIVHPHFALDEEFRARFRREVEAARRVGGAWTASVLDADPEAAVPWVATAYAAGPSLAAAVTEGGALPAHTVRALGAGLAEALTAVHELGLVHRDVKPSNVLLTLDGPLLIDFGIARATAGTASLTATGVSVGSPGYMAPEQILGKGVTGAADVFSLGAVLAYAATGEPPFPGDSSAALLYKVVHEEPELGSLTGELRQAAAACLAKDPAARPAPAELARRLAPEGAARLVTGGWLPGPLVEQVSRSAVHLLNLDTTDPAPSGPIRFSSPSISGTSPTGTPAAGVPAARPADFPGGSPAGGSPVGGAAGVTPPGAVASAGGFAGAGTSVGGVAGAEPSVGGASGAGASVGGFAGAGSSVGGVAGAEPSVGGASGAGASVGDAPGAGAPVGGFAAAGPSVGGAPVAGPPGGEFPVAGLSDGGAVVPGFARGGTAGSGFAGGGSAAKSPSVRGPAGPVPDGGWPGGGPGGSGAAGGVFGPAPSMTPPPAGSPATGAGPAGGEPTVVPGQRDAVAPPGKVTVSVAAASTPGESGRGRRVSCTVALAVAGALAAVTVGLGALLQPWARGDHDSAGSAPPAPHSSRPADGRTQEPGATQGARTPSPSRSRGTGTSGAVPARYIGTWEGEASGLGGSLPMGTFRLTVHRAGPGQELGRLKQTDQLGGVCTDILTLGKVTDTGIEATSTGAPGNHAGCNPTPHPVRLTPVGDDLKYASDSSAEGNPVARMSKVG
ncbi:serine/threonine protein kinase [Streptomyces collinus]|nr:serine/threonine-protein kinase [Streptomyces collinus]UJA09751.1 serine/threonine protein kinase [Streptomyces collinus]